MPIRTATPLAVRVPSFLRYWDSLHKQASRQLCRSANGIAHLFPLQSLFPGPRRRPFVIAHRATSLASHSHVLLSFFPSLSLVPSPSLVLLITHTEYASRIPSALWTTSPQPISNLRTFMVNSLSSPTTATIQQMPVLHSVL